MELQSRNMFKYPMLKSHLHFFAICLVIFLFAIASPAQKSSDSSHYRIYVTNERSGNLTVIDASTLQVTATVPLGKRPRGIHASPDGHFLYIALSGSPLAGPGVDESKLPPPDKTADGIGVFDVQQGKLMRMIQSGSDPENFDLTKDGRTIIVSNEDDAKASFIDIASGKVTKSVPVGEEPEGVKVSPNGKFVYVTSENTGTISAIDVATATLIKTFKVGHRPAPSPSCPTVPAPTSLLKMTAPSPSSTLRSTKPFKPSHWVSPESSSP